ncbi:MAG: hypothetical protein QNJ45_11130 [Ardenticatenaceae bacterium]|nr:hypothetical protein [Ardenticatenaceae bacterium]
MTQTPSPIYCQDEFGQLFPIPHDAVEEKTAVFGILLEGQKVLLQVNPVTDLLELPGGVLENNQSFDQGLRQLFRGATGAETTLGDLVFVNQSFHKVETGGVKQANLFFRLWRATTSKRHFIDFDNPLRPQWVPLRELERSKLQFGFDAIHAAAAFSA